VKRSAVVALAALAAAGIAAAARPGPPPEWRTRIAHDPLRAGAVATFTTRITSADTFSLDVSLRPLPDRLRLVGTRRSWTLVFPGDKVVERRVVLRVRVLPGTRAGTRRCIGLRQFTDSSGGKPSVVTSTSCGTVG
jgi:hypothetical protein